MAAGLDKIRAELASFKYSDYLRHLKTLEESAEQRRPLRIAVLRSYTAELMDPVLKLRLGLEGFATQIHYGDFNRYVQEILDPSSALYSFQPDIVLLLVRLEDVMPDFVDEFGKRALSEWGEMVVDKASQFGELVRRARDRLKSSFVVQNFCLPTSPYWGIYDNQRPGGQAELVADFNRRLVQELSGIGGAYVWDFNRLAQKVGYEQMFDAKGWFVSKSPYRQSVYPNIIDDLLRYLLSILGKSRKCVVLDLDGTLWGGVVGEDGLEGIQLGHSYPGNCFREFQKRLLALHDRGLILAINSKNNEADAFEAIDKHPDMILSREHFSAWRVNWDDKVRNLHALATELSIGVDSMIMLDDSPVECARIQQEIPECAVMRVPDKPYLIPQVCDVLPGIENVRLTDEDRKKGQMYRAQIARKRHESGFGDVDSFLESLELEIDIEPASAFTVPRIAQLTQKTNQMNLTTRRYTEAEVTSLCDTSTNVVFSVTARDRFGDNGIVGVFILRFEEADCSIDTFLLSCRVIGRSIEDAMLSFIADYARQNGAERLLGEYLPTAKNAPAADMYGRLGFQRLSDTVFVYDLAGTGLAGPSYVRVQAKTG